MASDDNLYSRSVNFNRFDWNAAPEPWRSIGLAWRVFCEREFSPHNLPSRNGLYQARGSTLMAECVRGHDAGRDSSGHCVVCRNEYKKAYYKRFPGTRRRERRATRARNKRRAEIAAAKAILMSAHRLRQIGVKAPG